MNKKFDLIVIGTGAAGSTVASGCRSAGKEVAIVDYHPYGGTCAVRGCDPKKVLVGAAEATDNDRRFTERGILKNRTAIDWQALIKFKRSFTDPVPASRLKSYSENGIATYQTKAKFVDATSIQVGGDTLSAKNIVIAAGAAPAKLNIPGEEHLINSTQFLELEQLPSRIIFVGGGYIAFEFAHIAARAGARVQVLHRGARPLERFDPDLVGMLVKASHEAGVEVRVNVAVEGVERQGNKFIIHGSAGNARESFEADLVVHAAGRVPEIEELDLDTAGVKWEKRGVVVNEHLQSVSNPSVYAAGDAAASGGPPLTPVAGYEGRIVVSNLLKGNRVKPDYTGIPSVLFSLPPLAAVGLMEDEAKKKGLKFRTNHADTSGWYSSRRIGEKHSGFKVLVEEQSNRILGAHLLGPHAEEVINIFAMAIRLGVRSDDFKKMIWSYPTSSSDVSYMV